ncbi:uncharacterized protein LOC127091135 [Lathyrus oleraceus]|uniref:Pectinesterase inhibitor domain-containing protein n=1 Tax=Pisum sativum TaxID=3888 RepID=A0A9D4WDJ8_PEA|nr:uncharacterized protein LOC127091135 [Pisum sativum]KAI5400121.1 hypothetical protein KIW84_065160 [Pisum sativum]
MKTSTICSVFLGLILISQYPFAANARSVGLRSGLIPVVCSASSDNAQCNSILGSNPQAAQAKSFPQLAKAVLEMAYDKAAAGQSFLKALAAETKSPALIQCANFDYDGVVMSFKSSLDELKEDPQTANYDAKVASDGTAQCDRGMAAGHVVNPEVTTLNSQITFYSELAFLVTNKL